MSAEISEKHVAAVARIADLARDDRYEGAFIFGSYATGNLHPNSDLDVVVLLRDSEESCAEVSHPVIHGIRLDISFNTMASLSKMTEDLLKDGVRKPWICEAFIVFDKSGRLQRLKERAIRDAKPARRNASDRDSIQYDVYYLYTKPGKYIASSPATANLIIHMGLRKVLDLHYKLNGRWWVSDKQMLTDLYEWDTALHLLLNDFLMVSDPEQKYDLWKEMIDHVLRPVGGRDFRRMEASCECARCQADLRRLSASMT
jgi:hypothetical protein